jgi:hypothetical protein
VPGPSFLTGHARIELSEHYEEQKTKV